MRARFLRAIHYHGKDPDTDRLARELSEQLLGLAKNPLLDGLLVELFDFGQYAATSEQTYPLTHQLGVKARGIIIVECRPKNKAALEPTAYPVHCPSADTTDKAYLAMTPYMAQNFLWTLWVW